MENKQKVYTMFPPLVHLIKVYQAAQEKELPAEESRIKLNQVVSKISYVYEKMRNAVDYAEEHLLRERAIRRNLQRTMTLPHRSGKLIAKSLVHDLIRSSYLPNNQLSETIINDAEVLIDKYIKLIDQIGRYKDKEEKVALFEWLISMLAIELDDLFVKKDKEDALIECMYQAVSKDIVVADDRYQESEKKIQLYVSILRSLMKADKARISLYLWKFYVPTWEESNENDLLKVVQHISDYHARIENHLIHPLNDLYIRVLKKYHVLFLIIQDIVNDNPVDALEFWKNPSLLEDKIRQSTKKRYKYSRVKLHRSIVRSIIYIFITKMILAVLIEFPIDIYFEGTSEFDKFPLIMNIVFPPALMFIIGAMIRIPGNKNTDKIAQGIKEISYQFDDRKVIHKIKRPLRRSVFMTRAFRVVYTVIFSLTFGLIFYGLHLLDFNLGSMIIFVFFLCLISFFSIRISQSARELYIVEKRDNFFSVIKDFFSLPILHFGRWLSENLSKINFFVILFDFVVEAPFKVLVDIIEEWTSYVKEKREELG